MNNYEQTEWTENATNRIEVSSNIDSYICLLDSGMNELHPLLKPVSNTIDMHTYNPSWGTHDGHTDGHGTPMGGLAIYGDLTELLSSEMPYEVKHKLESVKILPNSGGHPNKPESYGAITRESIARVEVNNRKRVFCMAVTTSDNRDRGKPSSWSATIDAIVSGAEDGQQRLMMISTGNTDPVSRVNYPHNNNEDTVHDPGQSWNALTIGGSTDKIHINDSDLSDYEPIAPYGGLSPSSCTSTTWDDANWPYKPDIVMEAGNMGIDRKLNFTSNIDDLELLSTHNNFNEKLLVNFRDTSAATALASRLIAQLQVEYPDFWPETLRALIVHAAEWTDELKSNFNFRTKVGYRQLLQYCGYGIPNPQKLFWSTRNSLTLIMEDKLQPFIKKGSSIKTKEINLHQIPWPKDILEGLRETEVEMKVTLSYFVEPNPGQRGWASKYRYASHRLQFDVKRSLETIEGFKQRVNDRSRDKNYNKNNTVNETGEWLIGLNQRNRGSVHSDTWIGTAADLASREFVAVYPMTGWWKELKSYQGWEKHARYSLIISLTTPETDIYTEVANQIRQEVEII